MSEKLKGQVRHVLTIVGTALIVAGVADQAEADELIRLGEIAAGSVANLVAHVWSWRSKA